MKGKMYTLKEFQTVAHEFISGLLPSQSSATVVGLYGDLGAGKTTFVQAAAKALKLPNHIVIPTFLIMRTYPLPFPPYVSLTHIDAYRLTDSDELKKLRFEDLLSDPKNLILIEWADKVADLLPADHIRIRLHHIDDSTRSIDGL